MASPIASQRREGMSGAAATAAKRNHELEDALDLCFDHARERRQQHARKQRSRCRARPLAGRQQALAEQRAEHDQESCWPAEQPVPLRSHRADAARVRAPRLQKCVNRVVAEQDGHQRQDGERDTG